MYLEPPNFVRSKLHFHNYVCLTPTCTYGSVNAHYGNCGVMQTMEIVKVKINVDLYSASSWEPDL